MLEKATIARPYAEAAFSQALEEGTLGDWSVFFGNLKLIVRDENMRHVIHNPKLSDQQLSELIIELCGEAISQTQKNFVRILVDGERISLAPEMAGLYEQSKAAAEGMSEVDVISAYTLDASQLSTISDAIAKRLGKKVDINASVDKELIGGIVIRAGDAVIDASVKGRLKELSNLFAQ
ncbi:MAG: F0F1 ATP synthase subunit delta [Gammaproteobacteria bacterium]